VGLVLPLWLVWPGFGSVSGNVRGQLFSWSHRFLFYEVIRAPDVTSRGSPTCVKQESAWLEWLVGLDEPEIGGKQPVNPTGSCFTQQTDPDETKHSWP